MVSVSGWRVFAEYANVRVPVASVTVFFCPRRVWVVVMSVVESE